MPKPIPPAHESRYTVRPGDCLWTIAKREYGDPTRWRVLFEANHPPLHRSRLIHPGTVLRVPLLAHLKAKHRGTTHGGWIVVHRGDSLWLLAKRHLGNPEKWRALYRANRDLIRNPRLIHPGQRFRLP